MEKNNNVNHILIRLVSESLMALALRKCIKQKKVNEKDTLNSKKIKTR